MMFTYVALAVLSIALVVLIALLQYVLDKKRVMTRCIRDGLKVTSIAWSPLAGLFERGERYYSVYHNEGGKQLRTYYKTGLLTGVFRGETEEINPVLPNIVCPYCAAQSNAVLACCEKCGKIIN